MCFMYVRMKEIPYCDKECPILKVDSNQPKDLDKSSGLVGQRSYSCAPLHADKTEMQMIQLR